jgi:hypothetical protein
MTVVITIVVAVAILAIHLKVVRPLLVKVGVL